MGCRVPEMNRLDNIARRSKRVGGAIADLWGSHLVGVYYRSVVDCWIGAEFYMSRGTCCMFLIVLWLSLP